MSRVSGERSAGCSSASRLLVVERQILRRAAVRSMTTIFSALRIPEGLRPAQSTGATFISPLRGRCPASRRACDEHLAARISFTRTVALGSSTYFDAAWTRMRAADPAYIRPRARRSAAKRDLAIRAYCTASADMSLSCQNTTASTSSVPMTCLPAAAAVTAPAAPFDGGGAIAALGGCGWRRRPVTPSGRRASSPLKRSSKSARSLVLAALRSCYCGIP